MLPVSICVEDLAAIHELAAAMYKFNDRCSSSLVAQAINIECVDTDLLLTIGLNKAFDFVIQVGSKNSGKEEKAIDNDEFTTSRPEPGAGS